MQQHPEVELDAGFNDQQMDLIGERVDMAVRIANLVDSTLLARKVCSVKILLVGSPSYFEKYGHPQHIHAALAQHRGRSAATRQRAATGAFTMSKATTRRPFLNC